MKYIYTLLIIFFWSMVFGQSPGFGRNLDTYLNLLENDVIYKNIYHNVDSVNLYIKPSFDNLYLRSIIKPFRSYEYSHEYRSNQIDSILLKYKLIDYVELDSIKNFLEYYKIDLHGYKYLHTINTITLKNMLKTHICKKNFYNNMFKDDILLKEKNQISVNTLFENISFIEILKLFKGVYELKAEKKSVEGISQFNKCFIEILKEIIPELKVNPLLNKRDQFNSKILISFGNKSYYYRLPYYSYFINPKYDKNGMKIFDKNIHLDFDGFYHNELINILRQIGADFNLGLVFEHINSASLFNSGYLDKNVEIFEGQLLLCVDKKIARDFGNMMIPITVDEYDELRDYFYSIRSVYYSNFKQNYIPYEQKFKLYQIINKHPDAFGVKNNEVLDEWWHFIEKNLFDTFMDLFKALYPKYVSVKGDFIHSYNFHNSFKDDFPNIYNLLGEDFKPININIKRKSYTVKMSFEVYGKNYEITAQRIDFWKSLLDKIIYILKENGQYSNKKIYEISNEYVDVKYYFYLNPEIRILMEKELNVNLKEL
ncbi:MAG: hypothetical protein WAT37_06510 [Saprospiraceae bacterium]